MNEGFLILDKSNKRHILLETCTFNLSKSVALVQSLSSLILVTRGNRMDIPAAVWMLELLNSAPVISHTGEACNTTWNMNQRVLEWRFSLQWNLQIMGPSILSFAERLFSFGLSFVWRFVLLWSVLYRRFHCRVVLYRRFHCRVERR